MKTSMAPLRGWGPRGRRLETHVPQSHWTTLTFLAALRCDRLTAPCVFDGPITGESLRAYAEQFLVPTLKPGDVVVLDNLGSHKGRAVRAPIRAVGAKIFFLPADSPDLNPVEQVFAKPKHLVRNAEPGTIEDTWRKVGDLVGVFAPHECANYLGNSGYAPVSTNHARNQWIDCPQQAYPRAAIGIAFRAVSKCCANSDSVSSPFTAANATLSLKVGVRFGRARRVVFFSCQDAILAAVRQKPD